MAKYTIELGKLVETGYKLALDNYPIFSEDYRRYLNQKIIEHFYFREIGQETADRFNFFLRRKMNEIMPYYNKMYESTLIEFDPLASEFFTEGTRTERGRDFEQWAKNRGKRGETIGEVFSSNEDMKNRYDMEHTLDENVDAKYEKSGDETVNVVGDKTVGVVGDKTIGVTGSKNIDKTGERTEDLSQSESGNELLTNNLKETQAETTKSNQTTTNDLNSHNVTSGSTTGTSNTTGSSDTTFSDIPQAGVETTVVTAPDGTVTRTTKGYATTTTNVDTTESNKTTGTSQGESTTDDTGTVKVEATGERNLTKDNTGTVNTDTTKETTNDNTVNTTENEKQSWTEDTKEHWTEDTKEHWTEDTEKNWSEKGTSNQVTGEKQTEGADTVQNNKLDSERNVANNSKYDNAHKEASNTKENIKNVLTGKGRKGISPAELIKQYRSSLVNVDMMVIDELEILFMGVY